MSPEDAILQILKQNSDTGLGILWHLLKGKGFDLSKEQVGAIVDQLIIKGEVRAIDTKATTFYALVERKLPQRRYGRIPKPREETGLRVAIKSAEDRIEDLKAKRTKLLARTAEMENEILDLSRRLYILKEQERDRQALLKELRQEQRQQRRAG